MCQPAGATTDLLELLQLLQKLFAAFARAVSASAEVVVVSTGAVFCEQGEHYNAKYEILIYI